MKTIGTISLVIGLASLHAQEIVPNRYLSIQNEMKLAISRGNQYLAEEQHDDGHWGDENYPAFTALALTAAVRDPAIDLSKPLPEHIKKGYQWLLEQQNDDGGIYNEGLSSYNTATSITALVAAKREAYEPAIVRARKYLIAQQWDLGDLGKTDNPNDGGIGYGSNDTHTDLSNSVLALEALALSKEIVGDDKFGDQPELDWDAAITFLSRCQNLEATNDQEWASDDPDNKGGFVYRPGESKAGEQKLDDGTVALRSYGSISYAGLLSLIYAEVSKDDPRIEAVMDWIGRNYTLETNPGMGLEGLYYYYQAIAKALSAAGVDELKLADGTTVDWRKDLGGKLLSVQREDGSWANQNSRWMESSPVLVSAYTLMALEQIYYSVPSRPEKE